MTYTQGNTVAKVRYNLIVKELNFISKPTNLCYDIFNYMVKNQIKKPSHSYWNKGIIDPLTVIHNLLSKGESYVKQTHAVIQGNESSFNIINKEYPEKNYCVYIYVYIYTHFNTTEH